MFRKMDDFHKSYATLVEGTLKLLRALDADSLGQTVAEGHRTLGGMAWHIVTTIPEMMNQVGMGMSSVDEKTPPPDTPAELVAGYEKASSELVAALKAKWDDDDLMRTDELYGETWPRGLTLQILIHHEIHHRGQLTVLMRQAGLKVPGIYGPSKEEWGQFGMEAPPY